MTVLLDTTLLIDLTRGSIEAAQYLDREFSSGEPPLTSIVSAMELLVGCRDQQEVGRMQKTLGRFAIIQLTPAISQLAYGLIAQYGRSHGLVIPDALIAATAMVEGLPLVTHNDRHFIMIAGLQIHRPY